MPNKPQKFTSNSGLDAISLELDQNEIRDDIEEYQDKPSPFKANKSKYDIEGSGKMSIPDGNVDELLDWAQNLPD